MTASRGKMVIARIVGFLQAASSAAALTIAFFVLRGVARERAGHGNNEPLPLDSKSRSTIWGWGFGPIPGLGLIIFSYQ
jgi:hypothetical protein